VFLIICVLGTARPLESIAKPVFRYVEFNGERKWPGQTHIVSRGVVLRVVAALEEPNKQSIFTEFILIDKNGEARRERMKKLSVDGIKEWHEYNLDTGALSPGSYQVRIRAWNAPREETEGYDAVKSEEVTWGDLNLQLEGEQVQTSQLKIPGFPWEASLPGLIAAAAFLISGRARKQPTVAASLGRVGGM